MAALPPLHGDILLEVFTHKSLRHSALPNDEYGDNERLAELGHQVFDLAVTYCLFLKRPMLTAQEMQAEKASVFSESNIQGWVRGYGLQSKLRHSESSAESIRSPEETLFLLESYIGALYFQSGMAPIQEWVRRLINPESEPNPPSAGSSYQLSAIYPPLPSSVPPPLPDMQVNTITLALVNQMAMQRRMLISYEAEVSGPSHQPSWVVRCKLNGVEKGSGVGTSQKKAKEEAARQAFLAMGWSQS